MAEQGLGAGPLAGVQGDATPQTLSSWCRACGQSLLHLHFFPIRGLSLKMCLAVEKFQGPELGRLWGDWTCPCAVAFLLTPAAVCPAPAPKFLLRPKLLCYLPLSQPSPPATGHNPRFVWSGSCHGSCPSRGLSVEGAAIPTAA